MNFEQRLEERLNEAKYDFPVINIDGEAFRVTGMNEKGERQLLNMDGETAGKILPDETIVMTGEKGQPLGVSYKGQKPEVTGPGDAPEGTSGPSKPSDSPPKGWDVSWNDHTTGVRTGRYFTAGIGIDRARKFFQALQKRGLEPKIREVRWKSEFAHAGMAPGQKKDKPKAKKEQKPKVPRRKRTQDPELIKQAMKMLGL